MKTLFLKRVSMSSIFRSYGGNLPSSFNMILSKPEFVQPVHQCRFKYGVLETESLFIQAFSWPFLETQKISFYLVSLKKGVTWIHMNDFLFLKKIKEPFYPLKTNFRFSLRGRFTLHRNTVCRKPRTFGSHDFHMIFRYSCQHSHFWYLNLIWQSNINDLQNVLLPFKFQI